MCRSIYAHMHTHTLTHVLKTFFGVVVLWMFLDGFHVFFSIQKPSSFWSKIKKHKCIFFTETFFPMWCFSICMWLESWKKFSAPRIVSWLHAHHAPGVCSWFFDLNPLRPGGRGQPGGRINQGPETGHLVAKLSQLGRNQWSPGPDRFLKKHIWLFGKVNLVFIYTMLIF